MAESWGDCRVRGGRGRVAGVNQALPFGRAFLGLTLPAHVAGPPLTLLVQGEQYGLPSGAGLALHCWLWSGGCHFYRGWQRSWQRNWGMFPGWLAPQHNAQSILSQGKSVVRPPILGNNNKSWHTVLAFTFAPKFIEMYKYNFFCYCSTALSNYWTVGLSNHQAVKYALSIIRQLDTNCQTMWQWLDSWTCTIQSLDNWTYNSDFSLKSQTFEQNIAGHYLNSRYFEGFCRILKTYLADGKHFV